MIRIEQFLFEQNIDKTQSEYLIEEFKDLMFNTNQEFYDFFSEKSIRLLKNMEVQDSTLSDRLVLLERMKNFKSSNDYEYVKDYIAEQKRIQSVINDGDVTNASSLLDSISVKPIDPFFNFIVRKILTGSETGVLPSERLKGLLDELTNRRQQEIDTEVDVTRDEFDRVVSFDNYLRNKGSLRINVLDERFTIETFNYVVDRQFEQLDEAVNAEQNILKKAAQFSELIPDDISQLDNKELAENLKNLILEDSNSVPSLQNRVENLQTEIDLLREVIDRKDESILDAERIIEELSVVRNTLLDESGVKDEAIVALNELIDVTLSDLGGRVSEQLTNTTDAFDAIATQIEAQAKKSEEAAAKQLQAFEKAIGDITGGLAEALKPSEPEPDPENPAAEIIKQILEKWDKMTVITESSYAKFTQILDLLGAKKPTKSTYVFVPQSKGNLFNPSEEIKQHLKWNNELKPQIKSFLTSIDDKKKAETILKNVSDIVNDSNGSFNNTGLYNTVVDALDLWVEDAPPARIRGVATPTIRKIALEVGANFPSTNDLGSDKAGAAGGASNIKGKLSRDTDQLINILTILDEIKNNGAGFGW